jgi:hypothetical protein
MSRALLRNRQFDNYWRHRGSRICRYRHRDKCIQEDGAIVVRGFDPWSIGSVVRLRVPLPMRVNSRPSRMVFGRVIVRMRVYKRSAQASGLYSHRERHREYFPHDALIVRDPAHGVKGAGSRTPNAAVTGVGTQRNRNATQNNRAFRRPPSSVLSMSAAVRNASH